MSVIGIGVDIEMVDRFAKHAQDHQSAFIRRVFSVREIEYCMQKKNCAQHLAARFCAKEAMIKAAHDVIELKLSDVQVHKQGQKPVLLPWSDNHKVLEFFKLHDIFLSLSHTDLFACAQVLIKKQRRNCAQ